MNEFEKPSLHQDFWAKLKGFTDARIGLGHTGSSLTTKHHLSFQLAHAQAQDAVWSPLEWSVLEQKLHEKKIDFLRLKSKADTRNTYLQRPDLGRLLSGDSEQLLQSKNLSNDVAIVVGDGLSSKAIEDNAFPFIDALLPALNQEGFSTNPIFLTEQARVAIGDPIADFSGAKHLIVLIGERPGLSSPNSLGIYYTFEAKPGHTDAQRNCISNVRQGGQSAKQAVKRLMWLMLEAEKRQFSGVRLKDDSQGKAESIEKTTNFLLPD